MTEKDIKINQPRVYLPFMENEMYKVLSWQSKLVSLKYLSYALICFTLNVYYGWTFCMILLAIITPKLLWRVTWSMFKS